MFSNVKIVFKVFFLLTILSTVSSNQKFSSCRQKSFKTDECNLYGIWKNELGSTVVFSCHDGQIKGKYTSAVGKAANWYNLTGSYTMASPKKDVTIASWVVSWNNDVKGNSESSTAWNGIFYPDEGVLYTLWTLVSYEEYKDYWKATNVGQDKFWRTCDVDEQL
ncbi:hypothetical protein ACF0H5_017392 [Mactra antiquata]